jgi:hypothetical protein
VTARASTNDTDPIRRQILAAIDRLLDGAPTRSTGRLSVTQLAAEAGLRRWHLTHQHTDLKDLFQARVRDLEAARVGQGTALDTLESLQKEHNGLRRHCAELEERLRTYATVIDLLTLENAALADSCDDTAKIVPLQRRGDREAFRHRDGVADLDMYRHPRSVIRPQL